MRHESILRQVALASYGTQFLRGELALEEWYRHGVFFDARLQFRALADNALLADDFTWWLGILRRSGAVRLSLHGLAEFELSVPRAMRGGDYAMVVHYADRHQVWIVGEERAAWQEHPLLPDDAYQTSPIFPDAASYGGDLDSYWCVEERPGELELPDTKWPQLTAAIAADLDITIPSSQVPAGPLFVAVPEDASWARLPLFPFSKGASVAHRLLGTLYREQAKFANITHPKNEGSVYKSLDDAGAAQADEWSARLDRWVIDVELRCANECREPALMHRGITRPEMRKEHAFSQMPAGVAQIKQEPAIPPAEAADINEEKPDGKWTSRIVFLVIIVVSSLFILASANIIAGFPWACILLGLPCALYVRYKNQR